MNFFEQQELARRNSRRLIVLFVLAIVAIVIAVNAAATLLYQFFVLPAAARGIGAQLPHGFYFTNTVVVVGLILRRNLAGDEPAEGRWQRRRATGRRTRG